jgi:TRAP-type C4-dicarboxylate transport system permease large subunit
MNLFVLSATVPDLKLTTVARGVFPFVSADLVRIAILVVFPALATFLPSTM